MGKLTKAEAALAAAEEREAILQQAVLDRCGERDAANKKLALIAAKGEEAVRWDQENLDAIPADYEGPGFTVHQYWRHRVAISKSWQRFFVQPDEARSAQEHGEA